MKDEKPIGSIAFILPPSSFFHNLESDSGIWIPASMSREV